MRTDRGRQRFYAAGWVISAGVMVVASRVWRLHLREVEQRAEEAERTRDEVARRRAVEERLRIARELHDSLTHNISVICVQSGVAVHLARKRGEEVSPALLAIQEASADAARELRTTLGVLRSDDDGDSSDLSHLDRLAARARASGLPVTVNIIGVQRALPPEVDQAAYRIVQEALTNVSRHAGPASAWVHLCYRPDALEIRVDDDGIGIAGTNANGTPNANGHTTNSNANNGHAHVTAHTTSNGLGLMGMRERVTALGGRLHAGPRDGGGFQVRAEIPAEVPRVLIRILLADDQSLIRSGIRSLLDAEDDIEVVAEAADGRQAVTLAAEHRPDIVLMDIQMPVLDGIEATRQIVADENLKEVRVVILTNFGLDEYIFRALRAGAAGFLLKETEPAGLLEALQVVMRGDSLLSPAITRRLISEFVARPPDAVAAAGMERLTNREREVAALVAHGLSNDEIAEAMVLSPATAKTHVSRAMIKLGARDRAQLVVFAYQAGLVSPKRRDNES